MNIRNAKLSDLEAIYNLECLNFQPDEIIPYSVIQDYLSKTPDSVVVIEDNESLVAYCISTVSNSKTISDDLFKSYRPCESNCAYLMILSLSIHPLYQGQGLGTMLLAVLKDYCHHKSYLGVSLTCHDYLISYYEMNGFKELGVSDSTFGNQLWFDMFLNMTE